MILYTFEDYIKEKGYGYKDIESYKNKSKNICYIPENAESIEDCFSYNSLKSEVFEFIIMNSDLFKDENYNLDKIVDTMFHDLTWEFPSTWLESTYK